MQIWYFRFEGRFKEESKIDGCKGVFSSCLVPDSNYNRAKTIFLSSLKKKAIDLIEIIEFFDIDGEELDPNDEKNSFWIKWYQETMKEKTVIFDTYHVFDDNS